MTSFTTATGHIAASPAPLFLLDTCALLDIIRAPAREKLGADAVRAANDLKQSLIATPRKCHVVLSHLVESEFRDNSAEPIGTTKKVVETSKQVLLAALELGLPGLPGQASPTLGDDLVGALERVANDIIAAATVIAPDTPCLERAFGRVKDKRRPARSGKIKDAYILEQYLAFVTQLRGLGFTERCLFVSSNVEDFAAEDNKSKPHPDLQAEYDNIKIDYFVGLAAALGFAKVGGP
jgi:hypothetical protein